MPVASFVMRLSRSTQAANCFKEAADRIGRVYLHPDFMQGGKLKVQIAADKAELAPGGYRSRLVPYKHTANKIRFVEEVDEAGELGDLYVSKQVLARLKLEETQAIAVRLSVEDA